MLRLLLPYYQADYQTELTPGQIGQCLTDRVITGFSLYSRKPYYGVITAYSFSVRRTSSSLKKESLQPRVNGMYKLINGHTMVTLNVQPHPILTGAFFLFGLPMALFTMFAIPAFVRTGEADGLLTSLVLAGILYGLFRLIFRVQSRADFRFWEGVLQLRPNRM